MVDKFTLFWIWSFAKIVQCHDRCLLLPFINVPCKHVAYQILKYVLGVCRNTTNEMGLGKAGRYTIIIDDSNQEWNKNINFE